MVWLNSMGQLQMKIVNNDSASVANLINIYERKLQP